MTKIDDKKPVNEITQKDRTIFCINIDERCTEDTLYELFLQVKMRNKNLLFIHFKNMICKLINFRLVQLNQLYVKQTVTVI